MTPPPPQRPLTPALSPEAGESGQSTGWVWHLTPAGRELFGDAGPDLAALGGVAVKQNLQRTICRAVVHGVPVFVKRVRPNTPRSWLRELVRRPKARLEFDNALALLARDVPTAQPLAWGRPAGWGPAESVLVTRELAGEPLADTLTRPLTPAARRELAKSLGHFYAGLLLAQVSHPDPHPGNLFALPDGRFALLDVHAVAIGPTNLKSVLSELTRFNRFFQMRASRPDRLRFWRAFTAALPPKHLAGDDSQLDTVARLIEDQTQDSNRRFWLARQKRHLGDNRDTHRVTGAAARGWAAHDLPTELVASWLANPDASFRDPSAKLLKDSRTSTVARVETPAGPVAYKRFNLKSPLLPLKSLGRPTPAKRSWLAGHGLLDRGLPTARPLACFQRHRFGLPTVGYLVCEWVPDATELPAAVAAMTPAEKRAFAWELGRTLRQFHERGLRHRDLKAANVLVAGGRPVFIDLVGVTPIRESAGGAGRRDLARLARSFDRSPHVGNGDRLRFLLAYIGRVTIPALGGSRLRALGAAWPLRRMAVRETWAAIASLADRGRSQRL